MTKNLMLQIAKLLGVEVGEKFRVNDSGVNILCGIYEDGLCKLNRDGSKRPGFGDDLLGKILRGKSEIVKLPWEPKYKEEYFYPNIRQKTVTIEQWTYETFDYAMKSLNMVYRTREEAEEHLAEDYERLTGKPLSSR